MLFAYLDEFGHAGPYFNRSHPRFNTSPVFGVAGIVLPEKAVRAFSGYFLAQKTHLLGADIKASGKPAYAWEKKGRNLYTPKSITKYPEIRKTTFRIINRIRDCGGKIFYYGREKIRNSTDVNSIGLYKTVLAHGIRRIESYAAGLDQNFVVVIDQHSAREELLITAAKTMYGKPPALHLASPPFEAESHLNENIQAADWIATLIGRMAAFEIAPAEFQEYEPYKRYFWNRIHAVASHSTVVERSARKAPAIEITGSQTIAAAIGNGANVIVATSSFKATKRD